MKVNLPIIDNEITYPEDWQLISTADLQGRITFVNVSMAINFDPPLANKIDPPLLV